MKLVKFGSLQNVLDGEKFLVVAPNGVIILCWWSQRGHFSAEENYDLMVNFGYAFDAIYEVPHNENTLVCKVEVEE